jgi:hypothetical protein
MMFLNADYVKQPRLFSGLEVEHTKHFGQQTLFVVDYVPLDEIVKYVTPEITHIYFGAGNLSRINLEVLIAVMLQYPKHKFTIESSISPNDVSKVSSVIFEVDLALILPVTNSGVFIGTKAVSNAIQWSAEPLSTTDIYLKVDTAAPEVIIVPINLVKDKVTLPDAYGEDKALCHFQFLGDVFCNLVL